MDDLSFLKAEDKSIPVTKDLPAIPDPSYLKKVPPKGIKTETKKNKYEKEYDAYCKWSALPKDKRHPKTVKDFEIQWKIPKGQTEYFKRREDYQNQRLTYFWDWAMDLWPDFVYGVYKRAVKDSSSDAKIFAELIAKKIDVAKPKVQVQNIMLVGVEQEKIDKLFTPKNYEDISEITPKKEIK